MTSQSWTGRVFLFPGVLLFVGEGASAAEHAHHAHQILVGLDGELTVEDASGARTTRLAFVRSDAAHAVRADATRVAFVLVDPESASGRDLDARLLGPPPISVDEVATWTPEAARAWVDRLLGPAAHGRELHPAVARALAILADELADPPKLDALAKRVGISPTRLTHLFGPQIGIPIRRYVLWLRILRASRAVAEGASLTRAAIDAGFADAAHLSRTFRETFGLSPSLVLPRLEFVAREPWR